MKLKKGKHKPSAFNRCIGNTLLTATYKNKRQWQGEFRKAVKKCRSNPEGNPQRVGKLEYEGHNLRWYPELKPQKGYKVEIYKGKSAMPIASGKTVKEALKIAKKNINDIFK